MKSIKKVLAMVAAGAGLFLVLSGQAKAADVPINTDTFPSEVFRYYVSKNYDNNKDGVLSDAELASVTAINLKLNYRKIGDLTGIEYFTGLKSLELYATSLDVLDVSGNPELSYLNCSFIGLKSLNASGNSKLKELICNDNQLTSLDISGCPELSRLGCSTNQLTSLDVSGCPELSLLNCNMNQLTSLDVSGCPKLSHLECYSNQLTSLDISGCPELSFLQCFSNQLASMDVSRNPALSRFECDKNIRNLSGAWIDMSEVPGFDMEKASRWENAIVNGTKVTAVDSRYSITYDYDCGQGYTKQFRLMPKEEPAVQPDPWRGSLARWKKNVTVKISGAGKVKISWTKLAGAMSYQIYRSTYSRGGYKRIKTVSGSATSYTVKGLKKNNVYYFKIGVKASLQNQTLTDETKIVSKKVYGKPAKLKLKASIKGDVLTLKWNRPSEVKKVVVYRKVNKKTYKKFKTLSPKKTSLKIPLGNLDKTNQYSFCVRTYYQKDGVQIWSASSNDVNLKH